MKHKRRGKVWDFRGTSVPLNFKKLFVNFQEWEFPRRAIQKWTFEQTAFEVFQDFVLFVTQKSSCQMSPSYRMVSFSFLSFASFSFCLAFPSKEMSYRALGSTDNSRTGRLKVQFYTIVTGDCLYTHVETYVCFQNLSTLPPSTMLYTDENWIVTRLPFRADQPKWIWHNHQIN